MADERKAGDRNLVRSTARYAAAIESIQASARR